MTTAMLPTQDVRVVQVLLSAMKPFGKPVFFEGAFERISDPAVHRQAVQLTATSGAHGIGFTNWLDRVGPKFFNDTLSGLSIPPQRRPRCGHPLALPLLLGLQGHPQGQGRRADPHRPAAGPPVPVPG